MLLDLKSRLCPPLDTHDEYYMLNFSVHVHIYLVEFVILMFSVALGTDSVTEA